MKREYFLTTERLGFSWWTGEDLELAKSLWGIPRCVGISVLPGSFRTTRSGSGWPWRWKMGSGIMSSTGRCLNWKQEGWPDAAA